MRIRTTPFWRSTDWSIIIILHPRLWSAAAAKANINWNAIFGYQATNKHKANGDIRNHANENTVISNRAILYLLTVAIKVISLSCFHRLQDRLALRRQDWSYCYICRSSALLRRWYPDSWRTAATLPSLEAHTTKQSFPWSDGHHVALWKGQLPQHFFKRQVADQRPVTIPFSACMTCSSTTYLSGLWRLFLFWTMPK